MVILKWLMFTKMTHEDHWLSGEGSGPSCHTTPASPAGGMSIGAIFETQAVMKTALKVWPECVQRF